MYQPPKMDKQLYPAWANSLAWLISMFPIIAIPGWFLYKYCVSGGFQVTIIACLIFAGAAFMDNSPGVCRKAEDGYSTGAHVPCSQYF